MFDIVNPLQSTSYTNKDFTSIYTELLDLTKELASTWDPSISNESDPGVILLKLNAIIGDKLSYNSDTNVLELFPLSVTQEKNARQLFEQLGYYMHWYKAATTNIAITWIGTKNSTTEYTIPAFTMVSDFNNTITYTLIGPVDNTDINTFEVGDQKLKLDGSTTSFKAIQGIPVQYTINGERLITINNLDNENRLYFPTLDIAENGIFITNANANNYTDWKKKDNLLVQSVSSDNLFYKFGVTQDTSTCYIEFPENAEEIFKNGIYITYIKTLGAEGNVSYKTIEKFYNEISPVEDDSVVFNTNNIRMLNYSSAINGENTQTINSAYKGYKSTVGIFETLITLRDYIGYILNSGLVSNGFVCDRTNDVQCTYNIMTEANDIDQLVTVVENGSDNKPLLTAFDLKLYLLQLPTSEMNTATTYSSTFDIISEAKQENIRTYIDDVKCISHDYAHILPITSTRSHFCYFKNKYPISCRIVTQYQLTNTAANEVVTNVRRALYETLNAQEVSFGEEVPTELIYNTIIGADERIKTVMLDNIEYTTYAVCYVDTLDTFIEVEISSDDANPITVIKNKSANFNVQVNEEIFTEKIGVGNYSSYQFIYDSANSTWRLNDEIVDIAEYGITIVGTPVQDDSIIVGISLKTQLREEVFVKSVLAGTTQFLIEDEEYDYKLDQICQEESEGEIEAIKTNTDIMFFDFDSGSSSITSESTVTLRNNETIQLYSPNLINGTTYSTYVKFEYRLNNPLKADEDYQLGSNEYFIMYWKESQTDNYYKYAIYGQGNILKLTAFDLPMNDGSSNIGKELVNYMTNTGTEADPIYYTDSNLDNRMTYAISQEVATITESNNTLSTTKTITIRKINQIVLTASDSYCYWILNQKSENSGNQETYRLFEVGEYSKILNSGEYFIYTDSTLTNLTILGAGTLIQRSDTTYVWEVQVKDAASIIENGISAFTESDWFKIAPSDATLSLTEQYYFNIGPGSEFKLRLSRNLKEYCIVQQLSSYPIEIYPDIWFSKVTGVGQFTFTYDGTNWYYDSQNIGNDISIYGINYVDASPSSGDTLVIGVFPYLVKICSEGVYIPDVASDPANPVWLPISLKDFDISYKEANATAFTPVASLNLTSSDYSWTARSLLALNTSNIQEQILLGGQSIECTLHNLYYNKEDITISSSSMCYFTIDDVDYSFTYDSNIDAGNIIFNLNEEELTINGELINYTENSTGTVEITLTNIMTIEGANLNTTPTGLNDFSIYPTTVMSSFDLNIDGGQKYSTYTVNNNLEIEYLKFYVYGKTISNSTQVHIAEDGELDLEFLANVPTGNVIEIPFKLPDGRYILPLIVGSEDLETGFLHVNLDGQPLSLISDESVTNFNKKQKYFVYFEIDDSTSNAISQAHTLHLEVNSNIGKNVPVILSNVYKFTLKEGLTEYQGRKMLKLLTMWDRDNLYNYIYKVDEDEEISDPLAGKSFFLSNHIYNAYTIAQMMNNTDISILGKR